MAAQNSRARNVPEKYVPSMKGNKYAIALTQITSSLQGSKDALCMVQRLVKLMGKGLHRCADIIGMVMAQVSMKKVHRDKTHKYLGMSLDFFHKGQCRVTMHDYIDGILQAYKLAIKDHDDG
jgi:hypothetical protein